jgi:serine/threonine protein kinase/tetratricopeptide (TPR) repeat protein
VVWDTVPAALGKRFRVLEPFGRGATGSLYLADESESGRRGLLKILSGVPKHREPERARLRRELAKQATLAPSRLVVPSASGETEGVTWLFRPWLDGVSLRVRLRQGDKLSTPDALAISAQLAIALDELHRGGLLHRDVKPGHVFLPTGGQGVARAQLIESGVCASLVRQGNSTIFGSPGYVAPEQLNGKLVSFRSDLYSLGCVMYEMLAGHPPFTGASDQAVLAAQLVGELPPLPGDLPDGIAALVRSLLAREPQERPFSAQKLRRTLDPYAPDGTPMNRQPTSTFATAPEPEKPVEKTAGAATVSVPPPPPPAALRSTKPSSAPRPTTRGMAPPPPPRGAQVRGDETSQIDVDMLEEIEGPQPPPAGSAAAADQTQELGTEHLFDVRRAAPSNTEAPSDRGRAARANSASEPPKDRTVPIRLEQILAIAPARLRAHSAPPVPEPERAPEPEVTQAAAQDSPPSKGTSGFPQPAVPLDQLTQLSTRAEPQAREPGTRPAATMQNSLFGQLPALADAEETTHDAAHATSEEQDDDAYAPSMGLRSDPPHTTTGETLDAEATIAMSPSFEQELAAQASGQTVDGDSEPRALQDTLHPLLMKPFADYRKLAYAAAAVALLGLGVFGVRAIVGDDDDELAAAQASPSRPGSVPTVEPVPAVEPAPSIVALAKPPKTAPAAAAQAAEEAKAAIEASANIPQAAPAPASAQPPATPTAPPPAEPAPAKPEPAPAKPEPAPVKAEPASAPELAAKAMPKPAAGVTPPVVAEPSPAALERQKSAASARDLREDRRRERRERREREIAEKKAAKAEAKAAKASSANTDRESKWAEARDQARTHYAAKRYKQAAQAYERASEYDPTSAGTFAGLAAARLQAGDPKGAVVAYQRAIQLSPSSAGFHAALGRAYVAVGDKSKAKAAYLRALSLDPNNASAKSSLKELGG